MLSQQELAGSPLFQDISYEEYRRMLVCFQTAQRSFQPDELIYDFSSSLVDAVGIIERGTAALIRIDQDGISTVMEELGAGGVFGRTLAFSSRDSLEVICRTPCDVLFIDYPHILKRCENACLHHSLLVRNMLKLMSDKAQKLSMRIDVLSRRSIREKLLCYFHQMTDAAGSSSFTMPCSLSTLADYIAADRSAMMRELKRLKEEKIVFANGRRFTFQP